jgi:hypothetical protein
MSPRLKKILTARQLQVLSSPGGALAGSVMLMDQRELDRFLKRWILGPY